MKNKKKSFFKLLIFSFSFVALLFSMVNFSISYLSVNDILNNSFVAGNTDIVVTEDFDATEKVKSNVAIKNEGNVPVYVRVAIEIYWEDSNGNILTETPVENTDYTITFDEGNRWVLGSDGFYYYSVPLDFEDNLNETEHLVQECRQIEEYSDGRILVVDVIAQSIQATPTIAVESAWKVNINDAGVLTPAV